ncbi:unnamed protein product [Adineta steineri]|uniref:Uncharacterized protein n=1 Tax=Adineta steineri TaxID=433720 RepID=A0A815JUK7_9BILA|nr:unnamed protein product [Adineta steineri]
MFSKRSKKRLKKSTQKPVHYVQLRTHRQWPNESNYKAHIEVHNSKLKPIVYDIDRHLNNKWINIRRSQLINDLNETYQQEIKNYFSHKINLIDYRYFSLNNQFDENEKCIRESFSRSIEITDQLIYLYKQIENGERYIYEYRLNILKYEFEQEQQSLKHLFIDREINELNNQINILNAIEQDDALKQLIQFKLDKRELQEKFVKEITMLRSDFQIQITSLKSTVDKIIYSNEQQTSIISKQCRSLYDKTIKSKERIDQEMISVYILKRKIKQIKKLINHIDTNSNQINQFKHCPQDHQNQLISKSKYSLIIFQQNRAQIILRRLCVLIDKVQKNLEKKLFKAERILLLINQCERLEFEDEKLLLIISKNNSQQITNKTFSQIKNLSNYNLEFHTYFDELDLFWKRFAHVQMDIYIRIQEKNSLKKFQNFFKKQLNVLC